MCRRSPLRRSAPLRRSVPPGETTGAFLAAGAAQAAKDAAVAAKDKLMEEAEALYERVRSGVVDVAGTVKEKGAEAVGSLEHTIEAKPLTSVLAALGIGFAVGWLATRK